MPVQQHDTMTPGLAAAIPPASAVNSPPQVEARSSLSPLSAALPLWLWPVAIVLAMLGLATANPMLTAVGILVVPLLVTLLWRSGEPPILLACCLMQWLQVMVPIFYADLVGNSLSLESMNLPSTDRWLFLTLPVFPTKPRPRGLASVAS